MQKKMENRCFLLFLVGFLSLRFTVAAPDLRYLRGTYPSSSGGYYWIFDCMVCGDGLNWVSGGYNVSYDQHSPFPGQVTYSGNRNRNKWTGSVLLSKLAREGHTCFNSLLVISSPIFVERGVECSSNSGRKYLTTVNDSQQPLKSKVNDDLTFQYLLGDTCLDDERASLTLLLFECTASEALQWQFDSMSVGTFNGGDRVTRSISTLNENRDTILSEAILIRRIGSQLTSLLILYIPANNSEILPVTCRSISNLTTLNISLESQTCVTNVASLTTNHPTPVPYSLSDNVDSNSSSINANTSTSNENSIGNSNGDSSANASGQG